MPSFWALGLSGRLLFSQILDPVYICELSWDSFCAEGSVWLAEL